MERSKNSADNNANDNPTNIDIARSRIKVYKYDLKIISTIHLPYYGVSIEYSSFSGDFIGNFMKFFSVDIQLVCS